MMPTVGFMVAGPRLEQHSGAIQSPNHAGDAVGALRCDPASELLGLASPTEEGLIAFSTASAHAQALAQMHLLHAHPQAQTRAFAAVQLQERLRIEAFAHLLGDPNLAAAVSQIAAPSVNVAAGPLVQAPCVLPGVGPMFSMTCPGTEPGSYSGNAMFMPPLPGQNAASLVRGAAVPREEGYPHQGGQAATQSCQSRSRGQRVQHEPDTLRSYLQQLQAEDPRCVFIVRRINKLGFRSKSALRAYYSQYGEVTRVLVPHSRVRPLVGPGDTQVRIRPGNLGLIVMRSPDSVSRILAEGPEQSVNGIGIQVNVFEQPQGDESEVGHHDANDAFDVFPHSPVPVATRCKLSAAPPPPLSTKAAPVVSTAHVPAITAFPAVLAVPTMPAVPDMRDFMAVLALPAEPAVPAVAAMPASMLATIGTNTAAELADGTESANAMHPMCLDPQLSLAFGQLGRIAMQLERSPANMTQQQCEESMHLANWVQQSLEEIEDKCHAQIIELLRRKAASATITPPGLEQRTGIASTSQQPAQERLPAVKSQSTTPSLALPKKQRSADKSHETRSAHLIELKNKDPQCVFIVRGINKLGFHSRDVLWQHFSQYGQVRMVLVSHSKTRVSNCHYRTRPSSVGHVVMNNPAEVQSVFAAGKNQSIQGQMVHMERFEWPTAREPPQFGRSDGMIGEYLTTSNVSTMESGSGNATSSSLSGENGTNGSGGSGTGSGSGGGNDGVRSDRSAGSSCDGSGTRSPVKSDVGFGDQKNGSREDGYDGSDECYTQPRNNDPMGDGPKCPVSPDGDGAAWHPPSH